MIPLIILKGISILWPDLIFIILLGASCFSTGHQASSWYLSLGLFCWGRVLVFFLHLQAGLDIMRGFALEQELNRWTESDLLHNPRIYVRGASHIENAFKRRATGSIFSLHSQLETYVYSMSLPKDGYPNENRPKWHLQDDIDKNAPNVDIATDLFGLLAPSGVHVDRRCL